MMNQQLSSRSKKILDQLQSYRVQDAPTHGGRVFSYVYDPDDAELDQLTAQAIEMMQPVNGLDPTVFTSVSKIEQSILAFMKQVLHAPTDDAEDAGTTRVWGTVTAGGTESCLVAVKAARELWREKNPDSDERPTIVAPSTVHAAFHKAAQYFDLDLVLIPVDPVTKIVDVAAFVAHMDDQTALVVVSAPNYPHGVLDPVTEISAAALAQNISCHVDACFGGLVLPWWSGASEQIWDFRLPGVTSVSADLHKFGYAPKGISVLLQRGRARHRAGYFAVKNWPGYPVANPTLLGSKSAAPMAAAWAIIQYLGVEGFQAQTAKIETARDEIAETVRKSIPGLKLSADTYGPVITVEADQSFPESERVDPHHLADRLSISYGWETQQQPGMTQDDETHLAGTTHLTITPVTLRILPEFLRDLIAAADQVRGVATVDAAQIIASFPAEVRDLIAKLQENENETATDGAPHAAPHTAVSLEALDLTGFLGVLLGGMSSQDSHETMLPKERAVLTALIEALPAALVERLLVEILALQSAGELG